MLDTVEAVFFVSGDFLFDETVLASFPYGTKVLSATKIGTSAWTITARMKVEHPNRAHVQCFLRCAAKDRSRVMMEGEYNATSELYKTTPNFVPKLISWGSVGNLEKYYFLSDFIDMSDCLPDQLCFKIGPDAPKQHVTYRRIWIACHVMPRSNTAGYVLGEQLD